MHDVCAEEGRTVCLVSTDVEGSTELWEWDREAMDAATKVHDRIMRSKLASFHGYEVNTEGDSFLIAFHEPADAIAWAITMQQACLYKAMKSSYCFLSLIPSFATQCMYH